MAFTLEFSVRSSTTPREPSLDRGKRRFPISAARWRFRCATATPRLASAIAPTNSLALRMAVRERKKLQSRLLWPICCDQHWDRWLVQSSLTFSNRFDCALTAAVRDRSKGRDASTCVRDDV